MNEQMIELAKQAGLKFPSETELSPAEKKFAELIVRECIVDFYRRYLDTTSDEDITSQVERYAQEHFGVTQ